ncbi:MAG: helix-turn-helix domain-containing protein [Solirubrobacteraceae bacterium]
MSEPKLLTVPQVAAEFQVTAQTIRNWIDHGTLPAVRVGRAFRVKRQDVEALLERASADSTSLATRRDLWQPTTTTLPHRHASDQPRSIWDATSDLATPRKAGAERRTPVDSSPRRSTRAR